MSKAEYDEQVTTRARQIMEAMLKRGINSMWNAHVLMALEPDAGKIVEIVDRGLGKSETGPQAPMTGGPFHILPADDHKNAVHAHLLHTCVCAQKQFIPFFSEQAKVQ